MHTEKLFYNSGTLDISLGNVITQTWNLALHLNDFGCEKENIIFFRSALDWLIWWAVECVCEIVLANGIFMLPSWILIVYFLFDWEKVRAVACFGVKNETFKILNTTQ